MVVSRWYSVPSNLTANQPSKTVSCFLFPVHHGPDLAPLKRGDRQNPAEVRIRSTEYRTPFANNAGSRRKQGQLTYYLRSTARSGQYAVPCLRLVPHTTQTTATPEGFRADLGMTQRQTVEAHGVLRTDTDNTLRCATEGSLPLRTQSLRRILAELPVCLNSEQGLPGRVAAPSSHS